MGLAHPSEATRPIRTGALIPLRPGVPYSVPGAGIEQVGRSTPSDDHQGLVDGGLEYADASLGRSRCNMGGHGDIGPVQQRVVWGEGLRIGDVEPGAEQVASVQRLEQGLLVHQPSPGGIDEHRAGLHSRKGFGVEHPALPGLIGT